jgi:hypothetical protein
MLVMVTTVSLSSQHDRVPDAAKATDKMTYSSFWKGACLTFSIEDRFRTNDLETLNEVL